MDARLEIPPCPTADVTALRRALGVSAATAQVLVRRELADPAAAGAWLAADEAHDPSAFAGMEDAVALVLRHVRQGTRITVHGDYDVDGVSATAILVGVLRELGAAVDWHLPSRTEDGYGVSAATVERLAARGTRLLVTADCGISAVAEVARARALGLDVVVTDHHAPRADGALPDAPVVHPALGGYPCPELCAAGVAHKLTAALLAAAGRDPARADADLDLVALATVADCVPLRGENRRLVRAGLRALARTRRPGLRALLRVAQADPGALDARTIGFRLAPRLNAAGRLQRADASLELLLTEDPGRAQAVAEELDRLNAERRHVETRIRFEAEAQVAELGRAHAAEGRGSVPAYVLWGEDWHPGVVGIVAARIAERHHRPAVLVALDGEHGTGSARSIPAFDLLGGLDACAPRLLRHGGHRAAAGCTVARSELEAFRADFAAHAAAVLAPEDLVPVQRIDAVVGGDELGLELAEELERLAPFGIANPDVTLLVPAARLRDPRPMGEGRHVRFTVESAGSLARGVAFGRGSLPEGPDGVLDAAFALERNEWQGAVEPRLVLRCARPPDPPPIAVLDPAHAAGHLATALAALVAPPLAAEPPPAAEPRRAAASPPAAEPRRAAASPLPAAPATPGGGPSRGGEVRDRRGCGVAGMLGALVASGEPVVVVCADAALRAKHLAGRLGGFGLCSYDALADAPTLADGAAHLVALDPPACAAHAALLAPGARRTVHLAWGPAETAFALRVLERDHDVRAPLAALYRDLRDGARPLAEALAEPAGVPRTPAAAARLLRILHELGLVEVDAEAGTASCPPAARTELERSPTFRASAARLAEGRRRLAPAAAAPAGGPPAETAPPAPAASAPAGPAEPLPALTAAGA